jgi:hypothetical protein
LETRQPGFDASGSTPVLRLLFLAAAHEGARKVQNQAEALLAWAEVAELESGAAGSTTKSVCWETTAALTVVNLASGRCRSSDQAATVRSRFRYSATRFRRETPAIFLL